MPLSRKAADVEPRDDRVELCTFSKLAQSAIPVVGLRARKKQETRETLAAAAISLALRYGLDRLRIEDIAAQANVSVRTFHNYFASTSDALVAFYAARMQHAAAALDARPANEPLWDAVTRAVLAPMEDMARGHTAPDPHAIAELRLIFGTPIVQAGIIQASMDPSSSFAAAVARRTRTSAQDMYPRLVSATVGIATQVAIDTFFRAKPPIPLAPLLRQVLDTLAAGLPDPSANPRPGTAIPDRAAE